MAKIPAYCARCDKLFRSGYSVSGSSKMIMHGCTSKCPACGQDVPLLDGVYESVGDALRVILQDARPDVLERFREVLERAKDSDSAALAKNIEKETPELRTISDVLPKKRTELYAFIAILLTIVNLLISDCRKSPPETHIHEYYIERSINLISQKKD